MVIATQNPIEQEGTFSLPEAQRDRFLMRLSLGYPSSEATNFASSLNQVIDLTSVRNLFPGFRQRPATDSGTTGQQAGSPTP